MCNALPGGHICIFPNINMHKNIYCHLKIKFHHIQYLNKDIGIKGQQNIVV